MFTSKWAVRAASHHVSPRGVSTKTMQGEAGGFVRGTIGNCSSKCSGWPWAESLDSQI
jgi:hypothetical protein